MLVALVITNCVFNVIFAITCGLVCYGVYKQKKSNSQKRMPDYRRK